MKQGSPETPLSKREYLDDTGPGARFRSGLQLKPEKIPPLVTIDKDASYGELSVHAETLRTFAIGMLDRLAAERSVGLSEPIGIYVAEAGKCIELAALLNSRAMPVPRKWKGLLLEEAQQMREEYARTLSRAFSQLELVNETTKTEDIITAKGKVAFWAALGVKQLLASTRIVLEDWGKVLAWEEANTPPEQGLEALIGI